MRLHSIILAASAVFVASCIAAEDAAAGYLIGIDFIGEPAVFTQLGTGNAATDGPTLVPRAITGETAFAAHGALQGVTEEQVRKSIVNAVQETFARADVGVPDRMLWIHIVEGRVPAAAGTTHLVGATKSGLGRPIYGIAEVEAAAYRPDLDTTDPMTPYCYPDNSFSATFLDGLETLPVSFSTLPQVVNAIAGTSTHEAGHTLGIAGHDPGTPDALGKYSVMASGETGLPAAARLEPRTFWAGSDALATLVAVAGTTAQSDFNFDGTVDAADAAILAAHWGQAGCITHGDATGDGRVDDADLDVYLRDAAAVPEPTAAVLACCGAIVVLLRPFVAQSSRQQLLRQCGFLLSGNNHLQGVP